jgi:hypothetical protein
MGILDSPQGQKLYLDTHIWIYSLEGYPEYRQNLHLLFAAINRGFQSVLQLTAIGLSDFFSAS